MSDRELFFSVDNQLLSELGERLVAKNYIALAELIKNAYDADAEEVTVSLKTKAPEGGQISIVDVGQGMTAEEVERYWMRVATDHKVREPRSPKYGRYKSGSKGIGRFACRRLAKSLDLKSVAKANGGFEVTTMHFDWRKLKGGNELAKEPFTAHVTHAARSKPGLTLEMKGLTERWTQRDFNILRRSLVDVSISRPEQRKGYQRDPGFRVILESDEFKTDDALLSEQYLNAGWGRLSATISDTGIADLELHSKGSPARRFRLQNSFPKCRGIEIDIAWIPGEKGHLRDPKLMTQSVRHQLEETEGGVKVYLDGFRVYPYGESGTDWLDISRRLARRIGNVDKTLRGIAEKLGVDAGRALLDHPKETTLVGKVSISAESSQSFVVKMDREGFIENEAFLELKTLVQLALQWMTVQYVHYKQNIAERNLERETENLAVFEKEAERAPARSPQAALNAAIDVVERVGKKGIDSVPGRQHSLSTAANVIRRSTDVMDARLAKLQILASTGPVVFAFAHEIKSLIARLATHANELDAVAKGLDRKEHDRILRVADDLRSTRKRLDHEVALFGTFSRSLEEDAPARQPVAKVIREVTSGFSYLASTFDIKIDLAAVDEKARTPVMRGAEVYSLLVNLISNAIKSCMAAGGHQIAVSCNRNEKLVIRVMDTGVGIETDNWEHVFEPLVADPEDKIYKRLAKRVPDEDLLTLGRGSGLGLSIVRDIARAHGGQVQFLPPKKPWHASVELVLP